MNDVYQAYLLRFSRTSESDPWRAMLQTTPDGQTHHFATERELMLFLLDRLANRPNPPFPTTQES